jgi:hypothetical protein
MGLLLYLGGNYANSGTVSLGSAQVYFTIL